MYMEQYTVKKLAALSGVSVRTLHLYDKIGLLKPGIRTEKKYRLYGRAEAMRLQQILFYRELGFPLKDIAGILDDPEFDHMESLNNQKRELIKRRDELSAMLQTIEKTIDHLKNKTMLSIEELYNGIPKEQVDSWRNEAEKKWGSDVSRSERHLQNKTPEEFAALKAAAKDNLEKLLVLAGEDPSGENVQKEIAVHYALTREFWGTSGLPDKQADAYAGLGDLYVSDDRYTSVNGKSNPDFAVFMQKAMRIFAKKLKNHE